MNYDRIHTQSFRKGVTLTSWAIVTSWAVLFFAGMFVGIALSR